MDDSDVIEAALLVYTKGKDMLSHDINQGIRDQFHTGSSGLPSHIRPYLQSPSSSVLNQPLLARQEWLRLVRQERALFQRPKHQQTRITSWRRN